MSAAPEVPTLETLQLEYLRLRRHAYELQLTHEELIGRLASGSSEFAAAQERTVAANLDALVARMRQIEAQLRLPRR